MDISSKLLVIAVGLFLVGLPHGTQGQESRDVNGRILGSAEWREINAPESDFFDSGHIDDFQIRRRKLPDRSQEAWVHRKNKTSGAMLTMAYERLYGSSFSSQAFDRNFEQI
jgi:hypothetical protein